MRCTSVFQLVLFILISSTIQGQFYISALVFNPKLESNSDELQMVEGIVSPFNSEYTLEFSSGNKVILGQYYKPGFPSDPSNLCFPNPFSNSLHLRLPAGINNQESTYKILTLDGRLAMKGNTQTVINTVSLYSGVYVPKIYHQVKTYSQKLSVLTSIYLSIDNQILIPSTN